MTPAFQALILLLGDEPRLMENFSDWDELVARARKEKLLLPLASAVEHPSVVTRIPDSVRETISKQASKRTLVELHRGRHLLELLDLLAEQEIPTKSFKGPTLSMMAHHRPAARECDDLDLLVPRSHFSKAEALLKRHGFDYEMENLPRCYSQFHYGVPMNRGPSRLTVDLHYDLFAPGYGFDLKPYWSGEHEVQIHGRPVPTFKPEETFLYLSLHGTKHCWTSLRWLYDLKALRKSIDLARLKELSVSLRCERPVRLAFWLLEQFWGQVVPSGFVLSHKELEWAAPTPGYIEGRRLPWSEYHRYQIFSQESVLKRFRLILWTYLSPQIHDLRWIDLPKQLWFLYYAVRPVRVLWEGIQR